MLFYQTHSVYNKRCNERAVASAKQAKRNTSLTLRISSRKLRLAPTFSYKR